MIARSEQRNPYKGSTPRPWVRLRFLAPDGTIQEREFLADTGNPCAIIMSPSELASLNYGKATNLSSNFGFLQGGWLRLAMPEFGLDCYLVGYGSEEVERAAKMKSPDFAGLAGLPFLRLVEYGGDADSFWLRSAIYSP